MLSRPNSAARLMLDGKRSRPMLATCHQHHHGREKNCKLTTLKPIAPGTNWVPSVPQRETPDLLRALAGRGSRIRESGER
jgi:hypothetical protein